MIYDVAIRKMIVTTMLDQLSRSTIAANLGKTIDDLKLIRLPRSSIVQGGNTLQK